MWQLTDIWKTNDDQTLISIAKQCRAIYILRIRYESEWLIRRNVISYSLRIVVVISFLIGMG